MAYSLIYERDPSDETHIMVSGYRGEITESDIVVISDTYNGVPVTKIAARAFFDCSSLTSIVIPNSITNIGSYAFAYCSKLANIEIPASTVSIGEAAFYSCKKLTNVKIPDGITNINWGTFYNCINLTSVFIPSSVTSIGNDVFYGCTSLNSIIVFKTTPPTLGSNAIPSNVQFIYVPQSSKELYNGHTNWNAFADKIVSDNLYLSFIRFNQKNKEYIGEKINESWNDFNLENGAGENSIQQKGNSSNGARSATFGEGNISNADNQFIIGKYADADAVPDARFIVGGGYSNTNRSNVLALLKNGELLLPKLPEQSNAVIRLDDLERAVYPIIVRTYSDTLLKASNVGHHYYFTDAYIITNSDKWIEPAGIHAENKVVTIVEITDSHTGNPAYFFKIVKLDERELYLTNGQGKCSIVKKAYGTDTTPKAIGYYSTVFSVNTDSAFGGQAASKYTTLFGVNVKANYNAEGSIVGGRYCIIDSPYTFAYGRGITTQANNETNAKVVLGYNNKFNPKAILEVGNGTNDNKSNAFEVLKDGRAKVQSAPVDDNDVVRKADLANVGGGGGKLYLHAVNVSDGRDLSGISLFFYTYSNIAFTPSTFKEYFSNYYKYLGITGKGNHENNRYTSYAFVDNSDPSHENDVITYYKIIDGIGSETTLELSEFNDSYGQFYDIVTEL